jgi:hypothetical protein
MHNQDHEYLRLLSIFHYAYGGLLVSVGILFLLPPFFQIFSFIWTSKFIWGLILPCFLGIIGIIIIPVCSIVSGKYLDQRKTIGLALLSPVLNVHLCPWVRY